MQPHNDDQAAGLRRLLARATAPVVTLVGARSGLGATSMVINLAAHWTKSDQAVLILDEHLSADNVANALGLKPRYDLLNVVRRELPLNEVILRTAHGICVLPVARAMQALPRLTMEERQRLSQTLLFAANGMDVLLVDAAAREGHSVSTSLSSEAPLVLVLNATASGITESYAMLKQMALENGRQAFDIVVNKVGNERDALAIFNNIQQVALQHLGVQLNYAGYVPADAQLQRATQCRQAAVDIFPLAPASQAIKILSHALLHDADSRREENDQWADVMQRLVRPLRSTNMMSAIL